MNSRISRALCAAVSVIGALAATQLVGTTPALAVSGVHMVESPPSATNSEAQKTVSATCPFGQRVIGGGGWVQRQDGPLTHRLALTQLQPIHPERIEDGLFDRYKVTAAETDPGTKAGWFVRAYAMCAPRFQLSGLHIVSAPTTPSSLLPKQATAAVCPSGERVIGTGGSISTTRGDVVLQVARASRPGDIARVLAHEDADGYSGTWSVTAHAVCLPLSGLDGYKVQHGASANRDSQVEKPAIARCPDGRQLLGAGAAITNVAPGHVSLQGIYPYTVGRQTHALAVENTPTDVDWDFIVATAICAD